METSRNGDRKWSPPTGEASRLVGIATMKCESDYRPARDAGCRGVNKGTGSAGDDGRGAGEWWCRVVEWSVGSGQWSVVNPRWSF
jgi:hypothetical protein